METKVEKLKESKIRTVTVVTEEERSAAEKQALERLAEQVEIKGFRVGKAPADKVRERVGEERLTEETVRVLLPKVLQDGMEKSQAKPILRPAATIESTKPLTISLIFVNRPPVTVKKAASIKIEKKALPEPTDAEVETFLKKVLLQDRTETPVERPVQKGDAVRLALSSNIKGKPVEELTVPNYGFILGSEELLPQLETHLIGMKKDEKKTVTIDFPKDHDIPALRGNKVSVEITLKSVGEVKIPELTQEYIKTRLQTDKTPEALRVDIRKMLGDRKRMDEMKRREDEFYDKIRAATSVELAPELIDAEVQEMVRDLHERLGQQNITMEDWLKSTGKDEKTVVEEMRGIAKSRTTLRFGMQQMAEEIKIEPDPESLSAALRAAEQQAKTSGTNVGSDAFVAGGPVYENIRYEMKMQTLRDRLIADETPKQTAA